MPRKTAAVSHLPQNATPERRKTANRFLQAVESKPIVLPCAAVQQQIAYEYYELCMDPTYHGEPSATLQQRHGIDERVIDRIVGRRGYAFEKGYAAHRTGELNTMAIAANVVRKTLEGR